MGRHVPREHGNRPEPVRQPMSRADYLAQADRNALLDDFGHPAQETFSSEEMRGSMQKILSENIGNFVLIESLIGMEEIVRKQGLLYLVGRNYVTLYDDVRENFIICDIFSIKFVYFYMPSDRPKYNYNTLPGSQLYCKMGK